MKQHVFKRSRVVKGVRVKAKTYSGRYRPVDALKHIQVALGVTDKQVAITKLAAIVKQAQWEMYGHVAPRLQVETLAMPLDSLIGDWVADIAVKGAGSHHCGVSKLNMGVLMRECGWKRVSDITPDSFIRWRGATRGRSAKTLKEYLGCVRGFLNWLVRSGCLPSDPLASVGKVETRGREVRQRRPFSHDEFLRLLAVTTPARRVVYAVAYYTGLRRSEIASLCWGDFNLSHVGPTFTILAEHAKNKERKTLPLQSDLREMLVGYFETCGSPDSSVKALRVPHRLDAFYLDLKKAGIPKVDDRGKILDFHSFRHSFGTRLASENIPLSAAMTLMRHSDPKLTAKLYVDHAALPLSASIGLLPGMSNENWLSPESSPTLGVSGEFVSQPVSTGELEANLQDAAFESLSLSLSPIVATCQMEPLVGFEPTDSELIVNELVGVVSPLSSPDLKLLFRIAENWGALSDCLKLAILAIVDSAPAKGGES